MECNDCVVACIDTVNALQKDPKKTPKRRDFIRLNNYQNNKFIFLCVLCVSVANRDKRQIGNLPKASA